MMSNKEGGRRRRYRELDRVEGMVDSEEEGECKMAETKERERGGEREGKENEREETERQRERVRNRERLRLTERRRGKWRREGGKEKGTQGARKRGTMIERGGAREKNEEREE